mgnify:CR=1 FL=1
MYQIKDVKFVSASKIPSNRRYVQGVKGGIRRQFYKDGTFYHENGFGGRLEVQRADWKIYTKDSNSRIHEASFQQARHRSGEKIEFHDWLQNCIKNTGGIIKILTSCWPNDKHSFITDSSFIENCFEWGPEFGILDFTEEEDDYIWK